MLLPLQYRKGCFILFYLKIIILFIAKIGFNLPMDDHHFGYITKLKGEELRSREHV